MIAARAFSVLGSAPGRSTRSTAVAYELGLQVWATDLWIGASENWQRIRDAGADGQVFPIHAEAHALPFAGGVFDAMVSLDAYHYFGTDDLYVGYYSRFVKDGGQIGIVVPGLQHELTAGLPDHLVPYWVWDFCSFHSPASWRSHWAKTNKVEVTHADTVPDGWKHWLTWLDVCLAAGFRADRQEAEMLRVDAGRNLLFSRVVARKTGQPPQGAA